MHFLLELRCEFYKTVFLMHGLRQQLNWQLQYGSFWSGVDGGTAFLIH